MVTSISRNRAPTMTMPAPRPGNSRGARRFDLEPALPTTSTRTEHQEERPIIDFSRTISSVEKQRDEIDRAIRSAMRGRTFSPTELLLLQSKVYAYSQNVEVISRMVDRVVSSVKTILNTQV